MTRTIPASDMRRLEAHLDVIKELTDLLRDAHFDVPGTVVYRAVGAEAAIRKMLLDASLTDVSVEPIMEAAE